MTGWLVDTLIWSGALIALVLFLRRPVGRWFGPQAAYALWLLPFLRLLLPPITLPAWMAPQPEAAPVSEAAYTVVTVPVETAAVAASTPVADSGVPIAAILLSIWLGGAIAFLYWRFTGYFAMRDKVLKDARPVGEVGDVRLVETPLVEAPLAFGVRDKVIAMPPAFMALRDSHARDLAIAHELSHHRGHDLLANVVAQVLLAVHWFNPLAWLGWRAMRRDQEAACDARVMRGCEVEDRAAYAEVIANFAASPEMALAAPMACPVLGEKSIIHRLRSLNMSEVSRSRRNAGKALLFAGALALPVTASVSYAAVDAPQPPEPPIALAAPPAVAPPDAPLAPEAPEAPEASELIISNDVDVTVTTLEGEDGKRKIYVVREGDIKDADGKTIEKTKKAHAIHWTQGPEWTDEEREQFFESLEKDIELRVEADVEHMERKLEKLRIHEADGHKMAMKFTADCDKDADMVDVKQKGDGQVMVICKSKIMASALNGLKRAREDVKRDTSLSEETRSEILESLDEQIRELSKI